MNYLSLLHYDMTNILCGHGVRTTGSNYHSITIPFQIIKFYWTKILKKVWGFNLQSSRHRFDPPA